MAGPVGSAEPVFVFTEIRDTVPRAIAALVSAAVYPGEAKTEIKKSDVTEARRLLQAPEELARRGISPNLHEALVGQLDALEAYLDSDRGRWSQRSDQTPAPLFCHAFKTHALFADDLRECANAVAECLDGKGGPHLSIGGYLKIAALFEHIKAGTEPAGEQAKEQLVRLKARLGDQRITRALFDVLHGVFNKEDVARFMMQHGPVKIGERPFTHVYRLDTEGLKIGDKGPDEIKSFILRHWEAEGKALHGSFYDRLYVEHDGDLYLLLNERGSVTRGKDAIPEDAAVAMRKNGRLEGVGRVVHRQEAINTPAEAFLKTLNDAKDFFHGNSELKELLEAEARHAQKDAKPDANLGLIKVLLAAFVGVETVSVAAGWGLLGLGALGVIATGRNVYNYVKASNDPFKMKPIYHAVGVGLSVDEIGPRKK